MRTKHRSISPGTPWAATLALCLSVALPAAAAAAAADGGKSHLWLIDVGDRSRDS
jgi:hypothetical protein